MLNPFRSRRTAILTTVTTVALAGVALVAVQTTSEASSYQATATIRTANHQTLGTAHFAVSRDKTVVTAHLKVPAGITARDAFHGFHIHANDNPANGSGCLADPAKAPATWFVSADGHLGADAAHTHGTHAGDLASLLVNKDGTADLSFTTGRFKPSDLKNRVVIFHAGADNFGNIPAGTGPDAYTPNSPAAVTKTGATGNAGDRIGCGVISLTR